MHKEENFQEGTLFILATDSLWDKREVDEDLLFRFGLGCGKGSVYGQSKCMSG